MRPFTSQLFPVFFSARIRASFTAPGFAGASELGRKPVAIPTATATSAKLKIERVRIIESRSLKRRAAKSLLAAVSRLGRDQCKVW
jgi:hypothetical protein